MVYIRIKKINNGSYAYLVESKNTPAGPRQKVKQYLGKITALQLQNNSPRSEIKTKSQREFVIELVKRELQRHGFSENKHFFQYEDIIFSLQELTIKKNNKETILHLNQGFLNTYTLQRLFSFKKTKDHTSDAPLLAKYFLEAGLPLSQQEFVQFYQLL